MNVRFFGGYKSEYVSIPKHNPIGLYFCADSRELFLGDKLLSDGLRVVPTFADLPSISEHKAAEGVIYFVESTKNGYVLPRGGYDWLQVIYAPTSGESAEVDLSNYYTKAEVDAAILKAITNIELEVDLSNYYTKSEIDKLIPDVSGFATKEELQEAIDSIEQPVIDLADYATKEEVAAIEAKIPSIEGLASTQYVDEKFDSITIPSIEGLATETFVKDEIAKIEIPAVPTKVSELENDAGFITKHQDISHLATKEELEDAISAIEHPVVDLSGYATKDALNAVANDTKALTVTTAKERYEVIKVPGLEVTYRDDEIRINTEHITLAHQNVGDGGNSNDYYIGVKIYAPVNATHIKQIITSTPGNFGDKEVVQFLDSDIDSYGRKYSNAWIKCGVYNEGSGTWLNYGMNSTVDKCLGYYYSVEWYDANGDVIENDSIHVVFTNDTCHYSSISDAASRRFSALEADVTNIENTYVQNETLENYVTNEYIQTQNFVTNNYIEQNYTTTEQLEKTYVTNEKVTEVVTKEVNTVVTDQIETKVTEVIQEKVDAGEIEIAVDKITYGDFEDDIL